MSSSTSAARWRELLQLEPHPEGGAFREVHRSGLTVEHPAIETGRARGRAALTSIYYLLNEGEFSAFHSVRSDEVWCLLDGGPLELHTIRPDGRHERNLLGRRVSAGESPQMVIPATHLMGARPGAGAKFALCACIVGPGFEFDDFDMPKREELLRRFPQHEEIICELSHAS